MYIFWLSAMVLTWVHFFSSTYLLHFYNITQPSILHLHLYYDLILCSEKDSAYENKKINHTISERVSLGVMIGITTVFFLKFSIAVFSIPSQHFFLENSQSATWEFLVITFFCLIGKRSLSLNSLKLNYLLL